MLAAGSLFVQPGGLWAWGMTLLTWAWLCLPAASFSQVSRSHWAQPVNTLGGKGAPVPPGTSGEEASQTYTPAAETQAGGGKLLQTGCSEAREALACGSCRVGQGLAGRSVVGPGLSPESQRWSLSRVVLDTLVSKESRRGRCGAGIQGR